ncbi:alpha/beta hydrolase [Flavihumibacter sp. RY-1]|uniref:Alpha/beta hydrolase n=1 Tax=Flavihumibacter fluminis TaxID=2909236 RepID=A0ABS9BIN7_9BACT|nr:alpha/beta hydrolase [Flavihumibacter fluminis]MCF1715054.1 alpha/beta hydrolase [Flavihumibacter fluminis]
MHPRLANWISQGKYTSFNGLSIFYRVLGEGPALLILHGYPFNGFDFEKLMDSLAERFTIILPDMPGMGFSDKPENHEYSFEEMADVYSAVLKELQTTEVHMLAHDLGDSVVQELLARDQEKTNLFTIRSVAFLNGGLFSDVYRPRRMQVLLSKSPAFLGSFISRSLTKKMVIRATSEVFGKYTKPSTELEEIFWDILNYKNGKRITYLLGRLVFAKLKYQSRWITAMQRTTIPLSFINGPADPNSGILMANRYMELLPNGNVYLLGKNIGHWPQIEAPEETLQKFYDFHSSLEK